MYGTQAAGFHVVSMTSFLFVLVNAAVSPLLYVYRLLAFRSSLKKIFCRERYLQEKRVKPRQKPRICVNTQLMFTMFCRITRFGI